MMKSSTGGEIVLTKNGLIHKGNTDRFDYERHVVVEGRGRGRPTQESQEMKVTWHPLFVTKVSIPDTYPGAQIVQKLKH